VRVLCLWLALSTVGLGSPTSYADPAAARAGHVQEDDAFDDDDFGEEDFEHKVVASNASLKTSVTGFTRSDIAFWAERFDTQPVAKLRQSLDLDFRLKADFFRMVVQLHGEYDFATLVDRDRYDAPTLEAYETKMNTREAFLAFELGDVQLTFGRIIDAWGAGDLLTILDVVNPRDLREPGTTDLDDVRLPVLASRIGWSGGRHILEAVVVHEHEPGYRPAPLSDYSPIPAMIAADPLASQFVEGKGLRYRVKEDRFRVDGQSFLFRWKWNGPSIDLSLMAGSLLDRQGILEVDPDLDLSQSEWQLDLLHPRYTLFGHAGSWVVEQFVVTWELAGEVERAFNVGEAPTFASTTGDLLSGMLGMRYTGVTDWVLSLEVRGSMLFEEVDDLLFDVEALNVAFLASYTTLSDRLELSAALFVSGATAQYGWMARGELGWRFSDGLRLGLGYVTYQPGEEIGLFFGLEQHDRLFMGFRWDFQLL
jgi:hypothetical protein